MKPVLNQIGTVFIPVSNVEMARDWYCDLLGLPVDGEVLFGHIYTLPMEGTRIVLDSKIYTSDTVFKKPVFHLNATDIEAVYEYMKGKNVELTTGIEHGHWFNFRDPDGNHIMVCKC